MIASVSNNFNAKTFQQQLKSLPEERIKPLSQQEEKALIKEYLSQGREEDLRQELIYHNFGLCWKMAKKYCKATRDFDDMISRCFEGLAIASKRFDFSKNIKFSTYATSWIMKYALLEFEGNKNKLIRESVSLNSVVNESKKNSKTQNLEDVLETQISADVKPNKHFLEDLEEKEMQSLSCFARDELLTSPDLTEDERTCLNMLFLQNKTQKETQTVLDLTRYDLLKLKDLALRKLKNAVQAEM